MTFAAPISRVSVLARGARALLIAGAAAALASCSMFDDFNPFGGEKYKMVIEPDVPASKAYDQGLAQLADGAPHDAAKKFTDLGEKFPDSDWARKGLLMTTYAQYEAGDFDSAEASAERYVKLYPKSQRGGLRALSRGEFLLPADPRHLARPGARRQGARGLPAGGQGLSRIPNMSRTRNTRSR